jgi:hypothetical protein
MKLRYFLIIFILTLHPVLSFGQEINNTEVKNKISYSFHAEHGVFLGGALGMYTIGLVNGVCLNKTQDILGVGVGFEIEFFDGWIFPIYANYRHYFPSKRIIKPLINIAIGTRLCYWDFKKPYEPGLYCVIASGFRVKVFSFTSGFFVRSWGNNFYGGIEIKAGCTFNAPKK